MYHGGFLSLGRLCLVRRWLTRSLSLSLSLSHTHTHTSARTYSLSRSHSRSWSHSFLLSTFPFFSHSHLLHNPHRSLSSHCLPHSLVHCCPLWPQLSLSLHSSHTHTHANTLSLATCRLGYREVYFWSSTKLFLSPYDSSNNFSLPAIHQRNMNSTIGSFKLGFAG